MRCCSYHTLSIYLPACLCVYVQGQRGHTSLQYKRRVQVYGGSCSLLLNHTTAIASQTRQRGKSQVKLTHVKPKWANTLISMLSRVEPFLGGSKLGG